MALASIKGTDGVGRSIFTISCFIVMLYTPLIVCKTTGSAFHNQAVLSSTETGLAHINSSSKAMVEYQTAKDNVDRILGVAPLEKELERKNSIADHKKSHAGQSALAWDFFVIKQP